MLKNFIPGAVTDPALERRLGRFGLIGKEDEWADRYLICDHLLDPATARPRQRFEALARFIRDSLSHRWVKTRQAREKTNPKRIYYLSMEYLIGRTLNNNMMNLAAEPIVQTALQRLADLSSNLEAQTRVEALYGNPEAWAQKTIVNVACSGRFSSDRAIAEYAAEIWNAKPSPVP